ncbi:MAG TPA: hypothetical protein VFK06_19205 [Candidatus Angelobacter sp.]|nr:hypothetical protein [Candidatus Angelobacter sp.]
MTRQIRFVCAAMLLSLLASFVSLQAQDAPDSSSPEKTAPAKKDHNTPGNTAEGPANFPLPNGPVELRSAHGTRITLKLSDTSRAIYEAIGRQAKISILFHPEYVPLAISVDLNGVTLEDALKIVAFQSRTFWRPVTSDSIFVAYDSPRNRHDFEQEVVKTFYLPNVSSPTDLQDIVTNLRTMTDTQRVQFLPSHRAIVVRGTPEQMVLAERLVDDLNRAQQKTGGQYRLEFKISELGDEKKAVAQSYILLIEPLQLGKLRIGQKIPVETHEKEKQYIDVGKNIDCQLRSETEHTVSLHLTVESSGISLDEHGTAESAHGDPVIQTAKMDTSTTLELGTPTVVGNFQDPVSKRNFLIEAMATRTRNKE